MKKAEEKRTELDENNKLIAEYMGYKPIWNNISNAYLVVREDKGVAARLQGYTVCRYYNSWDWLMEVFAKLRDEITLVSQNLRKSKKKSINKHALLKHLDDCYAMIRCDIWGTRIDNTFNGIAETIKIIQRKEYSEFNKGSITKTIYTYKPNHI